MEWIYVIGLIGYYLYKMYNKGIEKSSNTNKPIKKIERQPEKSFTEILDELLKQAENKNIEVPKPLPPPPQSPLPQQKKIQQKPIAQPKPIAPKESNRREDPIMYDHDVYNPSVEYDSNIENIFHKRYESIETKGHYRIEAVEDENYAIGNRKSKKFKGLLVDGRLLSAKEMLIAQTVFERKF